MKPYYKDDYITLYHGDSLTECREWLTADVLITDPPYGLQAKAGGYGRRDKHSREGRTIANDMDTTARDAVLADWGDKPVVCFGSPRLEDPPGAWTERLVWDKKTPGINGGPWRYQHESIFVRGCGWERPSNSSFSILRFGSDTLDRKEHPHAKPIQLMQALLLAAPAGVIADPFTGGGCNLAGL